jgi:hypothetical protein
MTNPARVVNCKLCKPKTDSHKESIRQAQLRNGGNGPEKHIIETITKIKDWLFENSAFKQNRTVTKRVEMDQ